MDGSTIFIPPYALAIPAKVRPYTRVSPQLVATCQSLPPVPPAFGGSTETSLRRGRPPSPPLLLFLCFLPAMASKSRLGR